MKINKYLSGIAASAVVVSCATAVSANAMQASAGTFKASESALKLNVTSGGYIVQMKAAPAITEASSLGELTPSNQLVAIGGNNYNSNSAAMRSYVKTLKQRQATVAAEIGVNNVVYNYTHTFNGFAASMTAAQANALRNHPDVAAVYADEIHRVQTSNTPAFLGLTGPDGQHTLGIKGEDVIVGVLDTGVSPDNPSFAEDSSVPEMTYGPAPDGWAGECNVGTVGSFTDASGTVLYDDSTAPTDLEFTCSNKLIGARYFGSTFSLGTEIQFGLGEFASPRDSDGHGSHTSSTAAGNAGVTAVIQGADVGTISGIAPRARVATYKVCWNANFVNEAGDNESGCSFGDTMAAIDQAVVDGVDVLNYSIGNSQNINSPVYIASLRAAEAGVFFAASAGNSGPAADTVSNIAPWIATVAASTYDGISAVIGSEVLVDGSDALFSVPAAIGTAIPEEGLNGEIGVARPIEACEPLTTDLTGQVALIARGSCPFVDKFQNAQDAGAIGVLVYTNNDGALFAMGGTDPGLLIPGSMISTVDGLALSDSGLDFAPVVTLTSNRPVSGSAVEVGNIMANFSSRGVNTQSGDILKPDITAPGVRILAASSPVQLRFGGNPQGENNAYLQGTSMSSPHIAGMAALLMGQFPEWTPAQVKSALMTTARQDIVKEDGLTPADPFDFGAGHAAPVAAMNPGLVYSANFGDYIGFLCGQGEDTLVTTLSGETCATVEGSGFATDASQLNYPSIAIAALEGSSTISRTVTDVTGEASSYTVSVEAPAGVNVSVTTFDADGNATDGAPVVVDANGTASYSVTFETTETTVQGTWVFGSLTLTGDNGIVVRSPIAINPAVIAPPATINVPETASVDLNRGRGVLFVETLYTGDFSIDYQGLVAPFGISGTTVNASGAVFDFGAAASVGDFTFITSPAGASVLRVALTDGLVSQPGANVDLHLWECVAFSCNPVETSENIDSNEDIIITNPLTRDDTAAGNVYLLFVHATDTAGVANVDYTVPVWSVSGAESTTRVTTSSRAIANRFQNISLRTRGLDDSQLYMGSITFFDADGENQGTTVLEVQP